VAGNGAEACNYLLAVDVEMNTVDGYAMSSWDTGYGDFAMKPDFAVVEHYLNNARVELDALEAAVTDWERVRGFERL
jgi:glutamine synthetase